MKSVHLHGWLAAAAITALLTAACGGGGGDTGPDPMKPPPASSATYTLTVDPNPLTATTATDDSRQAAQDFSTDGGTLSTTAADGTVYTLTVPGDALPGPVRITMTPLTQLQGTPFGDQVRGVQFGPDGLQFYSPVSLRITAPAGQAWPLAQQVPVGVRGSGGVVSLAALDPTDRDDAVFELMHFSSYALLLATKGMDASLEAVRHRLGGDADERLQSATAETLARLRNAQLATPPTGDLGTAMTTLFSAYESQVVQPRIAAAGSSCAAGRLALQSSLGLERQRELMGMGKYSMAELFAILDTVSTVCMKEEFEICRDEHILTRMVPMMLGAARQYALIDKQPPAALAAYADKCLRFELVLDSTAQYTDTDQSFPHTMSETVHAEVAIGFRSVLPEEVIGLFANGLLLQGDAAPLVSRSYRVVSSDTCKQISDLRPRNGALSVLSLDWIAKGGAVSERAKVDDFRVTLGLPQANTSDYQLRDCTADDTERLGDNWSSYCAGLLFGQQEAGVTATLGPALVGWAPGSGELLATRHSDTTEQYSNSSTRLQATLELHHRPAAE